MKSRNLFHTPLVVALNLPCIAQSQTPPKLSLDDAKPIVYVAFYHIGPRPQVEGNEPARGLWLRIVNNSVASIEVEVLDSATTPALKLIPDDIISRVTRIPKSGPTNDNAPVGYASGLGSTEIVESGKSFLFSVPVNHVGRSWYMEVPFRFHLPPVKQGVQPVCHGSSL
jgi:hypothetical protein